MPDEDEQAPECDCFSTYEDEDGETIHYAECAVIQWRLGLY